MPPDVQYTKTSRKDVKGRVIYQSAKGADKVRCKDAATGKMVWKKPPAAAKAKKPTMRKTPAPKATRRVRRQQGGGINIADLLKRWGEIKEEFITSHQSSPLSNVPPSVLDYFGTGAPELPDIPSGMMGIKLNVKFLEGFVENVNGAPTDRNTTVAGIKESLMRFVPPILKRKTDKSTDKSAKPGWRGGGDFTDKVTLYPAPDSKLSDGNLEEYTKTAEIVGEALRRLVKSIDASQSNDVINGNIANSLGELSKKLHGRSGGGGMSGGGIASALKGSWGDLADTFGRIHGNFKDIMLKGPLALGHALWVLFVESTLYTVKMVLLVLVCAGTSIVLGRDSLSDSDMVNALFDNDVATATASITCIGVYVCVSLIRFIVWCCILGIKLFG